MKHLLLLSLLCLASCATRDPVFDSLMSKAETNPRKDLVIGMWHRKNSDPANNIETRSTLLFRSDGTGVSRLVMTVSGKRNLEQQVNYSWTYSGEGIWKMTSDQGPPSNIKTAQGKLLFFRPSSFLVYERVE